MNLNAKVVISLFIILLAALGLKPYFSSSYENVVNGGFEEGSTGWFMGQGTMKSVIISTDAHSGSSCVKVGQIFQTFSIPIPTNDVVSAGFWYKSTGVGLTWYIFYEVNIIKREVAPSSVWTYVDLKPYISKGERITKIQFENSHYWETTALVDDVSIITVAPPSPQPLTVKISPSAVLINEGESATFTSSVSGGTSPYSYQWYVKKVEKGSTLEAISGATNPTLTYTPPSAGFYTVRLKVTDSQGRTAECEAAITVNAKQAPTAPSEYSLQVIVKDQCGNLLPAKVTIEGNSKQCENGMASFTVSAGTKTITAEVQVKDKTFSATQQVTVSGSSTVTITITRRFIICFHVSYTNGTLPNGKIIATSNKETLEIPVTSGYGESYFLDGRYRLSFVASPAVNVGEINVAKDGEFSFIIDPETQTVVNSTLTEWGQPPVTPQIPWVLIPSVYIYTLVGVLALGFIIAGVVALRRKK